MVDSHVNGGTVIDFLERFILYSNFKEIHIVVGNHDLKKQDGIDQLAYEYYKNKSKVFIYKEFKELTLEGKKCLFLPYYVGVNKYELTMSEFYSSIYKNKIFSNDYDLVVGHFCGEDTSFSNASDCIKNLDKINTKKLCLGHIHTRTANPNVYIGSVYACRRNENDDTRAALYLEGDEWKEDRLPKFNEFITFSYPDPLPESNALIPIYTILNCGNEKLARQKYGDVYIRKVTSSNEDWGYKKKERDFEFESIKNINIKDLFEDFVKIQTPPLSENVKKECEAALLSYVKQ